MEENLEVNVPEIENSVVFQRKIRLLNWLFYLSLVFFTFFFVITLIQPIFFILYAPNLFFGDDTTFILSLIAIPLTIIFLITIKFVFFPSKNKLIILLLLSIQILDLVPVFSLPSYLANAHTIYAIAAMEITITVFLLLFLLNRTRTLKITAVILLAISVMIKLYYSVELVLIIILFFKAIFIAFKMLGLLDNDVYNIAVIKRYRRKLIK